MAGLVPAIHALLHCSQRRGCVGRNEGLLRPTATSR